MNFKSILNHALVSQGKVFVPGINVADVMASIVNSERIRLFRPIVRRRYLSQGA